MKKYFIILLLILYIFSLFDIRCFADNYSASNQEELSNLISIAQEGDTVEITKSGTYILPDIPNNITIKAICDNVNINALNSLTTCLVPNGVTFDNLIFTYDQSGYRGFQHSGKIIMKNCTINELLFSFSDMEFYNCTFNQSSENNYCMWCYVGDITYDHCTFNVKGKALNLYNETYPGYPWIIRLKDCTFISDRINKSALNIKEYCDPYGKLHYTVLIDNCTTNDYFPTNKVGNNKLWMVDDLVEDGISRTLVFVDGVKSYPFDSSDFVYDGYQSLNDIPAVDDSIKDNELANKICEAITDTEIDLSSLAIDMSSDPSIIDDSIKSKVVTSDVMIDLTLYYNYETRICVETILKQKLCCFDYRDNKLNSYQVDITPMYAIKAFNIDDNSKFVLLSDGYKELNILDPITVKLYLPEGFVSNDKTNVYIKHNDVIYGDENDTLNGSIYPISDDDRWYIEFKNSNGFSKFEITTVDPNKKEEPFNPEHHDSSHNEKHLYSIPKTGIK